MIVFAGREGRWKYDEGTLELLIPRRLLFGARALEPACSCRLCCSVLKAGTVQARVSDRVATLEERVDMTLLLSVGPFKAMREATSNAIVSNVLNECQSSEVWSRRACRRSSLCLVSNRG